MIIMKENILIETKNDFTEYLLHNLTPQLYEGFLSMYKKAVELSANYDEKIKQGGNIINIGIIGLFKIFLEDIHNLSKEKIHKEYIRIKNSAKYSDFFDQLLVAIVNSHLAFFSNVNNNKYEKYCDIDGSVFIHRCYIDSSKNFSYMPELFDENKEKKHECFEIIKKSIINTIKTFLPFKIIINDYINTKNIKYNPEIIKKSINNKILNSPSDSETKEVIIMDKPITETKEVIIIDKPITETKEVIIMDKPITETKEVIIMDKPITETKEVIIMDNPITETKEVIIIDNPITETKEVIIMDKPITETKEVIIIDKPITETIEIAKEILVEKPFVETKNASVFDYLHIDNNDNDNDNDIIHPEQMEKILEQNIKPVEKNSVKFNDNDNELCKYVIKPPEKKRKPRK